MAEYICCKTCIERYCDGCNMLELEKALKLGYFNVFFDDKKQLRIKNIVQCKDCKYAMFEGGESYMCHMDADYNEDTGMYDGFCSWHNADWFCAGGRLRED